MPTDDVAGSPSPLSPSLRLNRCKSRDWDGSEPRIRKAWGTSETLRIPSFLKQMGLCVIKISNFKWALANLSNNPEKQFDHLPLLQT